MRIEGHYLGRVRNGRTTAPTAHPLLVDLSHSLGGVGAEEACAVRETDALQEIAVGVGAHRFLGPARFGRYLTRRPVEEIAFLHSGCPIDLDELECKHE